MPVAHDPVSQDCGAGAGDLTAPIFEAAISFFDSFDPQVGQTISSDFSLLL